jgi:putative IMPACT (imprinted ancient) family translation regulator
MQIYVQIKSFEVTNILIVSVRYFGGTKLGVGGLIAAYKTSAQLTLEVSDILKKKQLIYNINLRLIMI